MLFCTSQSQVNNLGKIGLCIQLLHWLLEELHCHVLSNEQLHQGSSLVSVGNLTSQYHS